MNISRPAGHWIAKCKRGDVRIMDNKRVELFDIIKGIMILFIIITHFHWVYPDDYLRYGFVFYIDMAVPVFMILTGYFYALSNSRRKVDTITAAFEV